MPFDHFWSTMIIQPTPNLSAHIPNFGEKNVLVSGIRLAAFGQRLEERVGLGLGLGADCQRETFELWVALGVAVGSHHLCVADLEGGVQNLFFGARRAHGTVHAIRIFLEAHQHLDLGAERLLIKIQRFFAAAVEEQIGLHVHGGSPLLDGSSECDV
jgi:hypothetical protein